MSDEFSSGLINYTDRDYESIMKDFYEMVPKITEMWKPEVESDPGVVLGKWLASVANMLGVNLDCLATEMFAPSVRQRKDAEKIFGLIGYKLGWYVCARTEVTFTNIGIDQMNLDFGYNGSNFTTLNAYTDISGNSRVITYNVLPLTNTFGANQSRASRKTITDEIDVFSETDIVRLKGGESVTRIAIEGELRSITVSVKEIKANNFIMKLPSQHVDPTSLWVRARATRTSDGFLETQWIQVDTPSDFITPEPRFCVSYDSYSNAQIQISNYLNELEEYENYYLTIFWIDSSGILGCVGTDVLTNCLFAKAGASSVTGQSDELAISNLSNTLELPHTYTVTGASPETAREAYYNSRNYINTFDSLVTLPDFNRFLNREPGVDCGLVIDCQKAFEINVAIHEDTGLTDSQKKKMYITNEDFPKGGSEFEWATVLGYDPEDARQFMFNANFQTHTALAYAVHNDFIDSSWGLGQISFAKIRNTNQFMRYKPPQQFIDNIIRDYTPIRAMSTKLDFGYLRVFTWYVVGDIYPKKPVDEFNAKNIIRRVKEALAIYFAPANRQIGQKPTVMEIVDTVKKADSRIEYFDVGSYKYGPIYWDDCDIECFNPISYARYKDAGESANNIRVNPAYIVGGGI